MAGYTYSFGAGYDDFLVLKLNSSGSYPDCPYLQDCTPTITFPNVSINSVNPTVTFPSITVNNVSLNVSSPSLLISDGCIPLGEPEYPPLSSTLLFFEAYYSSSNSIIIKYIIGKENMINLDLYNLSGNLIKNIYRGLQRKGYYVFEVETKDKIKEGIYFIKLKVGNSIFTRKVIILR